MARLKRCASNVFFGTQICIGVIQLGTSTPGTNNSMKNGIRKAGQINTYFVRIKVRDYILKPAIAKSASILGFIKNTFLRMRHLLIFHCIDVVSKLTNFDIVSSISGKNLMRGTKQGISSKASNSSTDSLFASSQFSTPFFQDKHKKLLWGLTGADP